MADKDDKKKRRAVVEEVTETPEGPISTEMAQDEAVIQEEAKEVTHPEEHSEVEHHAHGEHHELHNEGHLHQDNPVQVPPESLNSEKLNMKSVILMTAIIAIVFGGLAGGLIVYLGSFNQKAVTPSPSPISENSIPVATTSPATLDKTKFTVDVQNGSGTAGQGAAVSKILTDAGFKVGTVGNAKTYDYKKTVVQAKDSVTEDFLTALTDTLSKNYALDVTQKLATGSASDIIVIVGSTKSSQ